MSVYIARDATSTMGQCTMLLSIEGGRNYIYIYHLELVHIYRSDGKCSARWGIYRPWKGGGCGGGGGREYWSRTSHDVPTPWSHLTFAPTCNERGKDSRGRDGVLQCVSSFCVCAAILPLLWRSSH